MVILEMIIILVYVIAGNQLFHTLSFQPLTSPIVTVFYFPNEKNKTVYIYNDSLDVLSSNDARS